MNVCDCPGEPLLKDYLTGRLDRSTHAVIDDHLDACAACQSTADVLESVLDLSFPGLRAAAAVTSVPDNAAFRRLVEGVKAFGAGAPASNGESPGLEGEILGN